MGKVTELIQSTDGLIRSAKVKIQNSNTLCRPLCLLYPIETSGKMESNETVKRDTLVQPHDGSTHNSHRHIRKAAAVAMEKIKTRF